MISLLLALSAILFVSGMLLFASNREKPRVPIIMMAVGAVLGFIMLLVAIFQIASPL